LFTINKQLINKVLTYAVFEIYSEILKLLTTVSEFSGYGAMQIYIDIFCLKETLKHYLSANNESEKLVKKILDLIPNSSFHDNKKFENFYFIFILN
jgi:CRISPR/Cas system CMR-associated protein Cmr1 (group 7 of RAMP superfamily)